MKRKLTILLLCLLTLLACSCSKHMAKAEATEDTENSTTESEVPTPTATPKPIPTPRSRYIPGDDLYGMLSVTGDVVIEPQYNYLGLFTEENLARFQDYETGLWGYINESGEEVIPAQYEDAQDFSEGLAAVKVDGLYGFIDVSGEMVIEPQFEGVGSEFAYERCVIQENGMLGVIDQTGVSIVKPQYKSIEMYCESYFIVQSSEGEYGIIDRDGEVVVEYQDSEIYAVTDSGYYFVSGSDIENRDLMCNFTGNQYYVNKYHPEYILWQIHSDSKVVFSPDNALWGMIDLENGEYIFDPIYKSIFYTPGDNYAQINGLEIADLSSDEPRILENSEGAAVQYDYVIYSDESGNIGVMDIHGNPVLPAEYQHIVCSPNGEFAVLKDDVSYIIDASGTVLLSFPDYRFLEFIESLDCWVFYLESDSSYESFGDGFMRRDGTVILELDGDHYFANAQMSPEQGYYPYPLDGSTSITYEYDYSVDGDIGQMLIGSSGYLLDYPLYNGYGDGYTWFPYKGVIAISDKDGNEGLFTFDGKMLFEPCECTIPSTDWTDDSDYLIYTIPAQ